MNSRTVATILLLAAFLSAAPFGCKKEEKGEEKAAAATAVGRSLVSAEEKKKAKDELEAVWRSLEAPQETEFHRDLAVLTRHPHRLAGMGKVQVTVKDDGGNEKSTQLLDRLVRPETINRGEKDRLEVRILDAPGSLFASRYVENVLKDIGVDELYIQEFPVVQPVTEECELLVALKEKDASGKSKTLKLELYQARPNILQASVTPAEGLSGKTLYVKNGGLENYPGLPEDKIVVMDFDCLKNWQKAFALGARAVIFLGPADDKPAARAFHHVNVPANLPRFYVPAKVAAEAARAGVDLKTSQYVTIKSACRWTELLGRNVIGVIRGTDAKLIQGDSDQEKANNRKAEAVVLAAPLDSLSEVPYLSPGARDAGNCAALLELARGLQKNRPKRDIILCFFDGQAQNNLGARAFYGNTYRSAVRGAATLETIEEMYDDELKLRAYVMDIVDRLEQRFQKIDDVKKGAADPGQLKNDIERLGLFSSETREKPRYKEVLEVFHVEIRSISSNSLDAVTPLRLDRDKRKRKLPEANERHEELVRNRGELERRKEAVPTQLSGEIAGLADQLSNLRREIDSLSQKIDGLQAEYLAWNSIERVLYEGIDVDDPDQVREIHKKVTDAAERQALIGQTPRKFRELVEQTKQICERRVNELKNAKALAYQSKTLRDAVGPGNNNIILHLSINLGDRRTTWAFIHGDDSLVPQGDDSLQKYKPLFVVLQKLTKPDRLGEKVSGLFGKSIDLTYRNRSLAPAKFADSASIARLFGLFNLSVMTVMDPLPRQGQPVDAAEALNKANMLAQVRQLAPLMKEFADDDELKEVTPKVKVSAGYTESKWKSNKSEGALVARTGGASAMPDQPVRDAIVAAGPKTAEGPWNAGAIERVPPGLQHILIAATNANGNIDLPVHSEVTYGTTVLFAASFDDAPPGGKSRGMITAVTSAIGLASSGSLTNRIVVQFKTRSMTLVGYGFDRGAVGTEAMLAQSTAKFPEDRHLPCELGDVYTIYAPQDAEGVKLFNPSGMVILNNDSTADNYQGMGISLDDPFKHPVTVLLTAESVCNINLYRGDLLRVNRIAQQSIDRLNGIASDLLQDALRARTKLQAAEQESASPSTPGDKVVPAGKSEQPPADAEQKITVDKIVGDAAAAAENSRCAYGPLVSVMNDLVTAVVLLLLMTIPFAYALERLLIGTPHIYRQITWFGTFFILTFVILYFVNPAFRIASTPIIILLAFAIILLSTLVIFIMIRKLQTEIKKMQGLATTVHSADVSRLSTMLAAVNMGISTMRRRPLRTLLTAVTVLLLTFTILTFASFGSSWGVRETYEGPMTVARPHIFSRHQLRSVIGQAVFETLRGHFRGEAEVVPRYCVSPTAAEANAAGGDVGANDLLIAVEHGPRLQVQAVKAAVGLDARDVKYQEKLAEFFRVKPTPEEAKALADNKLTWPDIVTNRLEDDGIFLTEAICNELNLTMEDADKTVLSLADQELKFRGMVDDKLGGYTTLEGSSLLPVDYQMSAGAAGEAAQTTDESLREKPDIESAQFTSYSLHEIVWISAKTAARMSNRIRALTIYPKDPSTITDLGRRAARISKLPTYLGDRGGVYRYIFTSLTKASGWKDLLIPVVVGGMIVFATLLGSVSDREREIYTFSSLGLAPPHVAGLFFAEASVYAVVGGMGGYLLGQAVARLLGFLNTMGVVGAMTINYSSTNAIATILIVMCTVMISTIYPALKASRSANPGIQRSWKIPRPEGNLYDLVFPFTVSSYDITGVVSFLREHFDNYRDASLGVFATTECGVFRQKENDMLGFRASVALAPFDLGVNQRFGMLSQPSEIEGIDEVRILIYRISGANGDWRRANRVFINDLRKQLLIWRSLPDDTMDKYRQMTLEAWNSLPAEQVDSGTIAAATDQEAVPGSDAGAAWRAE